MLTNGTMNESATIYSLDPMEGYGIPNIVRGPLLTLYGLTVIFGVGGNAIVCFTVLNTHGLKTVTNLFIVSLSCCDIIMTALCVPFTVFSNLILYYWPFGTVMCPLVQYINLISVLQRTFILVAITLDRHHAIWRPLRRRIKKSEAKLIIATIAVISALLALPTAIFSKIVYLQYEPGSKGLCMEEWSEFKAHYLYSISITLLQYFIPLAVMIVTYTHIGIIIWIKRPPGEADSGRDMRLAASKRKTVLMLIVVTVTYAVSWLPIHTINLIGERDPSIYDDTTVHIIWLFFHWLALSNSGANPIIYCWMNAKFREAFLRVFHCLTCSRFRRISTLVYSKMSTRYFSTVRRSSMTRDVELNECGHGKICALLSISTTNINNDI